MKKYFAVLLFFIAFKTEAQFATPKVSFSNLSQMMAYAGSYTECFLDDDKRGGNFMLKNAPAVIDSGMSFPSGKAGKAWVRILQDKSIYLQWYGCKGDGVTNDYYRLKAFIDYVSRDSIAQTILNVYFEKSKTYYVDMKFNPAAPVNMDLRFMGMNGVNVYGGSSTILINGNFTRQTSTDRMVMLIFGSCTNILINNLIVDHQNQFSIRNGQKENTQMCFYVSGCDGVTLQNCTALNAGCDGFYFTASGIYECRNVIMMNCRSFFAARQALSIIQAYDMTVINCLFKYTGQHTNYSFAPQSGCDVEPNWTIRSNPRVSQNTGRISFYNCVFSGNGGSQFVCGGTPSSYSDITVQNCYLSDIDSVNGVMKGVNSGGYAIGLQGENVRFLNNTCTFKYGFLGLAYGQSNNASLAKTSLLIQGNTFYYSDTGYSWIRGETENMFSCKFINNQFIGDSTCRSAGTNYGLIYLSAGNISPLPERFLWDGNYLFAPKEKFFAGQPSDAVDFADLTGGWTVRNSTFATNLTLTYLGATNAHYYVNFDNKSSAQNVKFIGTNPGMNETFKPAPSAANTNISGFNSLTAYTIRNYAMVDSIAFEYGTLAPAMMKFGTAFPTTGTWTQGNIIWNKNVTAGGAVGWICTTGNSSGGVWKVIGTATAYKTSTLSIVLTIVASLLILIITVAALPYALPALKARLLQKDIIVPKE